MADTPQTASAIQAEPRVVASVAAATSQRSDAIPTIEGSRSYEVFKRSLDLALGAVGLVITGLLSIGIIPLIQRRSPGPPVFAQTRVGKGGKTFTCYKFRTMNPDADLLKNEVAHLNEVQGPVFKIANDPRGVPELKWLRKYSLDELPQFWNVLRGDMSLVGPRPPVPDEVEDYTPEQLGRLAVKPGLTCTWQVNGRSNVSFDDWVAMDLDYISRRSTALDLELFVRTIPAMVSGRGAS
ncbi:MAG: sugar transferase [Planctomycetaceae bacterium]